MRASAFFMIPLLVFMLLLDLYSWRGIKVLVRRIGFKWIRQAIRGLYWGLSVLIILGFILFMLRIKHVKQAEAYIFAGRLVAVFAVFYLPKLLFIVFVLIRDFLLLIDGLIKWIRRSRKKSSEKKSVGRTMERTEFLYQMGLFLAAIPFASIVYGVTKGKFNYRVMRERIRFNNIPESFKGLKIVQISDMHLGSFNKRFDPVAKAVELINEQEPDLIFFTGDLVNNFAEETEGWAPVLSQMKAKIGKYSILGNHDYGDYSEWSSPEEKEKNLAAIKGFHKKMGFRLMLNENESIRINDEEISLIGIENWGKPPFPQHGDLNKALEGVSTESFKLLLSHDPSHWDAQVLDKTNIDLTFAGHTHGMQFGIERIGIKWSPIQYKYPRWGGLYTEGKQHLYVNRGFGYLGFPGRVGMPPEITVVELA